MRTTLLHPLTAGRVGILGAIGTASQRRGRASWVSACRVSKAVSPRMFSAPEKADELLPSSSLGGSPSHPHLELSLIHI